MTDQDTSLEEKKGKKRLITRNAWIVCSIVSLLMATSNASRSGARGPGEFIPSVIGGFIGALALLAGSWAIVVLIFRWISRKRHVA